MGVRLFRREEDAGMVSRSAAGLAGGVVGRVGGTQKSKVWRRLVELPCVFAREEAVGAMYPDTGLANDAPELGPCAGFLSESEGSDAFRDNWRRGGGDTGLRPECDFCPRSPTFAVRNELEAEGALG